MTAPVDGRSIVLNSVSEADFQRFVFDVAKRGNWITYHTYRSDRSPRGFPDVVAVRPPRVLFIELKKQRGTVSEAQAVWLAYLRACPGVEVYIWRPEDEATVKEVLA